MKILKPDYTATKIGLIYTLIGFLLSWTSITYFISTIPILFLGEIFGLSFRQEDFDLPKIMLGLFAVLIILIWLYLRFVTREIEENSRFNPNFCHSLMIFLFFIVHPWTGSIYLTFSFEISLKGIFSDEDNIFMWSSFFFILFGFLIDRVKNATIKSNPSLE